MRVVISLLAAGVLALGSSACSSRTRTVGAKPSWRAGKGKAGVRASSSTFVFAPSATAVGRYNDPPVLPAPSAPLADAIVTALSKIAGEASMRAPVPDGRLYAAAAELARIVPENGPLPYKAVEFALQRHGILEPSPHLVVIWGPVDKPEPIMEQLAGRLPKILASGRFARVGVGSAARSGSDAGAVTVLALQASHLRTKPIPRALPRGGVIGIDGEVLHPFRNPEVFVTREDGKVEQPPLARAGAAGFRAKVSCQGHKGRQQIEVTAVDDSGSTVLANFPVWCNASPPTSITIRPSIEDSAPVKSADEAEQRMVQQVNRDRKRYGLPPLLLDKRVREVARKHSKDMRQTGVVAHVSATTGSASDRVRVAGIKTSVVMENVARAYGVTEAQEGLMNSPGHRANILSKLVTHVGVGIELGEEVAGRREMFVTQVFIRIPPPVRASEVKRKVLAKIARVSQIGHDAELSRMAQSYATDVAAGIDSKTATRRASKYADSLARRFAKATTIVTTVASLAGFEPRAILTDKGITHYGVGIGQGTHGVIGEGAIYIVLVLATSR